MLKTLRHARLDGTHDAELRKLIAVDILILDDFALDAIKHASMTIRHNIVRGELDVSKGRTEEERRRRCCASTCCRCSANSSSTGGVVLGLATAAVAVVRARQEDR